MRRRMVDNEFQEFQTPILTASSPEGARDYLVPSRLHHVSGCEPTTVCEQSSTERTHGCPFRVRVLFLM